MTLSWQTQVQENMSVGRRFSALGSSAFEIRAEFFNIFNRTYLNTPRRQPARDAHLHALGEPTGGFGYATDRDAAAAAAQWANRRALRVLIATLLGMSVHRPFWPVNAVPPLYTPCVCFMSMLPRRPLTGARPQPSPKAILEYRMFILIGSAGGLRVCRHRGCLGRRRPVAGARSR